MKLLFCHDGPMAVDKDMNAYPQSFTEEVFLRYYAIADEIAYLTRTKLIDPSKSKVPKANMDKLKIVSVPNMSSIKGIIVGRSESNKILLDEMQYCDYVIVRLPSQIGNLAIDMAIKMKSLI